MHKHMSDDQPVTIFGSFASSSYDDNDQQHMSTSDLWQWRTGQWRLLVEHIPGFTDRSTVIHKHWLISCFATDCICFNTLDTTTSSCTSDQDPTSSSFLAPRVIHVMKQISVDHVLVLEKGSRSSSIIHGYRSNRQQKASCTTGTSGREDK